MPNYSQAAIILIPITNVSSNHFPFSPQKYNFFCIYANFICKNRKFVVPLQKISNTMAKIKPIRTIDSMSGKVAQNTNISERVRNGKTFSYTWNPETPEKITPKKVLMQYAMKLANIRAKEVLANPELKADYAKELQKDKNYNELRPFIVAKFFRQIKESVLTGNEESSWYAHRYRSNTPSRLRHNRPDTR